MFVQLWGCLRPHKCILKIHSLETFIANEHLNVGPLFWALRFLFQTDFDKKISYLARWGIWNILWLSLKLWEVCPERSATCRMVVVTTQQWKRGFVEWVRKEKPCCFPDWRRSPQLNVVFRAAQLQLMTISIKMSLSWRCSKGKHLNGEKWQRHKGKAEKERDRCRL